MVDMGREVVRPVFGEHSLGCPQHPVGLEGLLQVPGQAAAIGDDCSQLLHLQGQGSSCGRRPPARAAGRVQPHTSSRFPAAAPVGLPNRQRAGGALGWGAQQVPAYPEHCFQGSEQCMFINYPKNNGKCVKERKDPFHLHGQALSTVPACTREGFRARLPLEGIGLAVCCCLVEGGVE